MMAVQYDWVMVKFQVLNHRACSGVLHYHVPDNHMDLTYKVYA